MARIKTAGESAVYHCILRVVGGQMLLDDPGKEKLAELLGRLAEFCGVEVITYCMMSNHVHLLLRVPVRVELSDAKLLAQEGLKLRGKIDSDIRESVVRRMGDVSVFMQELKQRFSRWYNKVTGRFGTLWAERFTSLVVEDSVTALRTVAAYIDLNPVRAGLVKDPKDYRFCGYSAALTGAKAVRQGLMSFLEPKD